MKTGWGKYINRNCEHLTTMVVISAGIERIVCEACAHVSFQFVDDMPSQVELDRFARHLEPVQAA